MANDAPIDDNKSDLDKLLSDENLTDSNSVSQKNHDLYNGYADMASSLAENFGKSGSKIAFAIKSGQYLFNAIDEKTRNIATNAISVLDFYNENPLVTKEDHEYYNLALKLLIKAMEKEEKLKENELKKSKNKLERGLQPITIGYSTSDGYKLPTIPAPDFITDPLKNEVDSKEISLHEYRKLIEEINNLVKASESKLKTFSEQGSVIPNSATVPSSSETQKTLPITDIQGRFKQILSDKKTVDLYSILKMNNDKYNTVADQSSTLLSLVLPPKGGLVVSSAIDMVMGVVNLPYKRKKEIEDNVINILKFYENNPLESKTDYEKVDRALRLLMTAVEEEGLLKEEKLKDLESEYKTISSPISLNGFYGYDGLYKGKAILPSEDMVNPAKLAVIAQRKKLERNNNLLKGVKNVREFTKNAVERVKEKEKEDENPPVVAEQNSTLPKAARLNVPPLSRPKNSSSNVTEKKIALPKVIKSNPPIAEQNSTLPKAARLNVPPLSKQKNGRSAVAEKKPAPGLFDQLGNLGQSASIWATPALTLMESKLQQFSPYLAQANMGLAEYQPEAYLSAKGSSCCCSPSHSAATGTVINQNTSITLSSNCQDPQQIGQAVADKQDKVNRDLVRQITSRTS